ncbi:hypothetical protein [Clostridium sp. WB02_MRS01]|uniref:hypothetical protein n=1 Tax=Clostridium sp. WB02_MRS01 TaxID=2605777 RepID=UPI0018A6B624|nr:hypothetical protein [Clostridium sp. WB02_MRS01]
MTTVQSMMLPVCFGAVVGTLIAEVVWMIRFAVEEHKKKKRKRKEKEEAADKAE